MREDRIRRRYAWMIPGRRSRLSRDRLGTLYCYYQYLQYRLEPDEEKKDAVIRLFRKKLEDVNGRFYVQLLQLKDDAGDV